MIDFPGSELLVVFIVAILVLSPQQLVSLARTMGRLLHMVRKQTAPLHAVWKSWQQEIYLAENESRARDVEQDNSKA